METRILTLLLISFFLIPIQIHAQSQIIALDVGEGQSVLIKHGNDGVLIDTGHAGQATSLLEKLNQYNIKHLKSIILTHLHPDHASAYFRLKETFPSAEIFTNCHPLPTNILPDTTRWINEALQQDKQHRCLKAGDTLTFNKIKISTLWPGKFISSDLNHHSLVLNITINGKMILLMADAGFEAEHILRKENLLPTNILTLVVGHHGANDATSKEFINHVKPEMAVISVNKNNIRGYPSQQTIDRLQSMNIKLKRTDTHGDIVIH